MLVGLDEQKELLFTDFEAASSSIPPITKSVYPITKVYPLL